MLITQRETHKQTEEEIAFKIILSAFLLSFSPPRRHHHHDKPSIYKGNSPWNLHWLRAEEEKKHLLRSIRREDVQES